MNKLTQAIVSSVVALAAASGCQPVERIPPVALAPSGGACDAAAASICYEFTGVNHSGSSGNELACSLLGGQLGDFRCDFESFDYLGACTIDLGTSDEYTLFYYESDLFRDEIDAENDCLDPNSSIHAQGAGLFIPVETVVVAR